MICKLAVQNGKRMNEKMMLDVVAKEQPKVELPMQSSGDKLKDLLLQCLNDALDIIKQSDLQFDLEAIHKLRLL